MTNRRNWIPRDEENFDEHTDPVLRCSFIFGEWTRSRVLDQEKKAMGGWHLEYPLVGTF